MYNAVYLKQKIFLTNRKNYSLHNNPNSEGGIPEPLSDTSSDSTPLSFVRTSGCEE
jgi:hypothetical protein